MLLVLRQKILRYLAAFLLFSLILWGGNFLSAPSFQNTNTYQSFSVGGVISPGSFVYAQNLSFDPKSDGAYAESTKAQLDFVRTLERLLRVMYLLLWPLLAIAGASMDNSLVYGSMFYLDTMLWKFWQIMRTFANFAIGFLFIVSILASFFGQKVGGKELKDVLKNAFIAGILVQMSRWILAVLLDFSTIGVLAIGALPLNVLEDTDEGLDKLRMMKTYSIYNMDIEKENNVDTSQHNVVFGCSGGSQNESEKSAVSAAKNSGHISSVDIIEKKYYLPCRINHGQLIEKGKKGSNEPLTRESYKNQFITAWKTNEGIDIKEDNISDNYCMYGHDLIKNTGKLELTCQNLDDAKKQGALMMQAQNCSKLSDITKSAEGMSGPLFTLFSSIMRMSNLAMNTNTQGLVETSLTFLLKTIVGIVLLMPLFALSVVMVIRAVILWLIIAFSPFLILMYVYKFTADSAKTGGGNLSSVKDVLGLIFMPVFVVFAVSMSLVFLSLISRIEMIRLSETKSTDAKTRQERIDPASALGCINILPDDVDAKNPINSCDDVSSRCYDICGITTMCFQDSTRNIGSNILNTFGWSVSSFFGIAMMWMLVFAALKTSKFTETIVTTMQGRGKILATAAPIIPVPGIGMQSLGSLGKTAGKIKAIPEEIARDQRNKSALADRIRQFEERRGGDSKQIATNISNTLTKASSDRDGAVLDANNIMKNAKTSSGHKFENIGKIAALSAGVNNYDNISSLGDALKDKSVVKHFAKTGIYNKLVSNLGGRAGSKEYKDIGTAVKVGLEDNANKIGTIKAVNGGYSQLYKVDNSIVQYITSDSDGDVFVSMKTYTMSNPLGVNSSKEDINEFGKLIISYGKLANIPSNPLYDTLLSAMKNQTIADDTTTTITVLTKQIKITKDSSGNITQVIVV